MTELNVLLLGPAGAGKSELFSWLVRGKNVGVYDPTIEQLGDCMVEWQDKKYNVHLTEAGGLISHARGHVH